MNWIDPGSGDVVKRVRLDGYPYGTPVVASDRLFVLVGGPHWKLLSLDSRKGTTIWQKDSETEWSTYRPLLTESLVIVGNTDHTLCAFGQADGSLRWSRTVEGVPRGLGVAPDRTLLVGGLSGTVCAYRLTGDDVE